MKPDVSVASLRRRPAKKQKLPLPADNGQSDDCQRLAAALLEAMPQAVALYGPDGLINANSAMANLLGHAGLKDFLAQAPNRLPDLFVVEDRPKWEALINISKTMPETKGQTWLERRDKIHVPVGFQLRSLEFGGNLCFLAIFSNVAVESATPGEIFKANEDQFFKLIESMPYGLTLSDMSGVVRYCNPAFNHILGYDAGELTGKKVWQLVAKDKNISRGEFVASILHEYPTPLPNIGRCRKKNGELVDILINWIYDRDKNGNVVGFLSVMTDVTQRLKIETELRNSKDLAERASREKSKFLTAASHDLQQPLHSMSILLGLLQQPCSVEKQQQLVETMGLALDGAMALLRSVLDISKLEADVITPRLEDFDLESSFDQIVAELGPQIIHKPVKFRLVKTSAIVHSDRMLLKSILHNLVSNAIRYTSRGKILVGCRRIGRRIRIEVRDTGRGIPSEKQTEIFEEFKRLEGPVEEKQVYALGLGLSIVDRTCQLLGYKVKLWSKVGRGSCFSFEVPLSSWANKRLPLNGDKKQNAGLDFNHLSGKKVLLIEDDFSTLAHTNMLLESWGCDCMAAESAFQALKEAARQTPDIILADYNISGDATGLMVTEKIRKLCQEDIPVIIITSDIKPEVIAETRDRGFSLLEKPASSSRLRALMNHYLQQD